MLTLGDIETVRRLVKEEVEAALASAGQSSPLVLHGDPAATQLIVNGNIIEWSRLINIFDNIGSNCAFIYTHLRDENLQIADPDVGAHLSANRKSAMRKAVTMRDSARQMASLLRGENPHADYEEGEID